MITILIIGRMGQVAWELQRELACLGHVVLADRNSSPYAIDLLDNDSITTTVAAVAPDVIINAAAYTAVDLAETAVDAAMQVNGHALAVLAEAAKKCGALLIHYSTDYVFAGLATTPYVESHPTAPQSVYGQSKLLGEQAIQASGVDYLILRTAWVYGGRGKNFLLTMLRLMRERDSLSVVADQLGSPTWSRQIATTTALLVAKLIQQGHIAAGEHSGIYHLSNAGQTSWFGFAERIYQLANDVGMLEHAVQLQAISTADYPTPAKRPAYSVLCGQKLADTFALALPDWSVSLDHCFADLRPN